MRRISILKGLNLGAVVIAFMLLPNFTAIAQQLKISARLDSTTIRIGDQVKLHFDIDMPGNAKVKLPAFKDTISGKIEVVKTFPPDSSKKNGILHIRQDLLITSFDSGYHEVPPIDFPFEIGKVKDTLRSTILHLTVNTLPVDTTKGIHDIKPPLSVPFSLLDYWQYIAGFFALVFVAFIIWYIIKLRKKESLFGTGKTYVHPHVLALRELDVLRGEKLWQTGKIKSYYTRLTEIIRTYIENSFHINALEMTSDEIVNALKEIGMEDFNNIELVQKMFLTADLVKFAKWQPVQDENEINLLNAYQFVNNTKPIVTTPVESSETNDGNADTTESK